MLIRRIHFPTSVVALVTIFSTATAWSQTPLVQRIAAIVEAPEFKHSHWGLAIVDRADGQTLYEHNSDKLFAPASTTKLFSTAAAMVELGADYRFATQVHASGKIEEGVLHGDLVLVASGDLTLGGRTDADGRIAFVDSDHTYAGFSEESQLTAPDPLAGLNELARQVSAAGIHEVRGNVVIDDRLFDAAESTGSGPARLTPMLVNDNLIDVRIVPSSQGAPAIVDWRPRTAAYTVDAQVETAPASAATQLSVTEPAPGRLIVRGKIGADRPPFVAVREVGDPTSFARSLFVEALVRGGIRVEASPLAANDLQGFLRNAAGRGESQVIATLHSPPFSENARLILKVSHNLHASTLPLLLAAKHGERTLADGLRRQRQTLLSLGVDVDSISFGGAAGGDRADYVTPRATIQLLQAMSRRPDFTAYRNALPILGVDGTLAKSVAADSPARGKVQAKTGTLLYQNTMNGRWILTSKALAGYATTASGKELTFAFFVNHVDLAAPQDRDGIGKVLGSICEVMYETQ